MDRRRKIKELMGIFKDKASIIKANLSTHSRTASLVHLAVIRATTHHHNTPPPDHRLSAILALRDRSYLIQSLCIDAVLDRLHKTHSPYVALKCLLIIHNIISSGFSIFKKQFTIQPLENRPNSLNLMSFRNDENQETLELSSWVRWYAGFLECNLIASRVLGLSLSSSRTIACDARKYTGDDSVDSIDSVSVKEINSLVCMVEEICKVPESLYYQKNNVVHDLMILVGKDYRSTQHQIMRRLGDLGGRVGWLSLSDSAELMSCLKRLEECRGRLTEIFGTRMRNIDFWELISKTKMEISDRGKRLLEWW